MADYYKILECSRDASDDEIKKSYRKMAMQYHPDRNAGSAESEEKFKAITEAYDVLRDPNKRALYDRYGEAGLRGGAGGFHHVDLSEALNIFMRDLGGLGGLTLRQIRASLGDRLRDVGPTREASDLLNVFIDEGDQLFDNAMDLNTDTVVLGQASVLAEQPEFSSVDNMRKLVALTETREKLGELLLRRSEAGGVSITIGNEHNDPKLASFTVVTASYHAGPLTGVIGVIGPTRMPYDKVISLVTHASELVTDLLKENSRNHG